MPDGTVYGREGAAATSHPLATGIGIQLLRAGGSAVDAAIGMAAALTVVEPTSNGLGGDAFALVHDGETLHGLNASGRSPRALRPDLPELSGLSAFPKLGWLPVTVPGAPAAWADLHLRFGNLPFARVLEPAIRLADGGHAVAPMVSHYWKMAAERYGAQSAPLFDAWRSTFAPRERGPEPGEWVTLPDHARTLRRIAASESRDLYEGDLARVIADHAASTGGLLTAEDLAAHGNDWVDPIGMDHRDATLWELPPNGQGAVALSALGMLSGRPVPAWDDPASLHAEIEAIKLAFADAQAHITDPEHMVRDVADLLAPDYLARRAGLIGERAELRETGLPREGGTVYLSVADAKGMMVSYIQSNFMGFGSGVVVPGTGIAFQNRGAGFTLEADHPNAPGPSKRPLHTIIPGFLGRDGKPWGPIGVMGGHMQPQGHVQVARRLVDLRWTPQAALDAPRWHWHEGLRVTLEAAWPRETVDFLRAAGHEIEVTHSPKWFGRGQVILRGPDGTYAAGSERRCDGCALAF